MYAFVCRHRIPTIVGVIGILITLVYMYWKTRNNLRRYTHESQDNLKRLRVRHYVLLPGKELNLDTFKKNDSLITHQNSPYNNNSKALFVIHKTAMIV